MKVLGLSPCQNASKLSTESLCEFMMGYLKAHGSRKETYLNNLLILVCNQYTNQTAYLLFLQLKFSRRESLFEKKYQQKTNICMMRFENG